MAEGQFGESGEHRGVDCAGVVKEDADNLTDKSGLGRGYGRGIIRGGILDLLAVLNRCEGCRTVGRSETRNNAKATQGGGDVTRHAEGNGAVGAIVCESHADVFCGGGVEVELVFLAEGGLEMGEGGSVMVFDEKIIDDEGEHEAVGVWRKRQAGLVEW